MLCAWCQKEVTGTDLQIALARNGGEQFCSIECKTAKMDHDDNQARMTKLKERQAGKRAKAA